MTYRITSSIQTTQIYLDIQQQTVDWTLEEWNEKWFADNKPSEIELPKEDDLIPDFLKQQIIVIL